MCIIVAYAVEKVLKNYKAKSVVFGLSITLMMYSLFTVVWGIYLAPEGGAATGGQDKPASVFQVALGVRGEEDWLVKDTTYRTGLFLKKLPEGAKVLALGEAAFYYLPSTVEGAVVFDNHPVEEMLRKSKTADEFEKIVYQTGYTHILIHWSELARLHATYYRAYDFNFQEQEILRKFFENNVKKNISPGMRMWPRWGVEPREVPHLISEDYSTYCKAFGLKGDKISLYSPYLKARPWAGIFYPEEEKQSAVRFASLLKDWYVILAPSKHGGASPVGKFPVELLELEGVHNYHALK
jgi:hypothetical protein